MILLLAVLTALDPIQLRVWEFAAAHKNCGVVVGVRADGTSRVVGAGTVFLPGGERPPDGQTVFEIGSITKPLTGILLAEAVRRGEVKLDDPAAKHLPPDLAPPTRDPATPVTLEQLATHRSGLPAQPAGIGLFSKVPANPYADFDRRKLAATLARIEPSKKPGEEYRYSNLAAGLLGHALVNVAKADSFDALLKERLCKPLGLKDTGEALTGGQRARFARGHTADGKSTSPWDFACLEACGGVRSTVDDMLKFAAACLGEPKTDLLPSIHSAIEPRQDVAGPSRIGLFWMTTRHAKDADKPPIVWHNGGTGGYRSILVLVPERRVAVVVLCSVATDDVDRLGL
ncbi:MAG: beta-lactamase family protein, partial [Gemmataceae bacterium]|nr:beta-lactamase family protein [Gemmataceae bacterium]